jgi:hypothetical protein
VATFNVHLDHGRLQGLAAPVWMQRQGHGRRLVGQLEALLAGAGVGSLAVVLEPEVRRRGGGVIGVQCVWARAFVEVVAWVCVKQSRGAGECVVSISAWPMATHQTPLPPAGDAQGREARA